ncbi:hypothetical protein JCM10450v2_002035 [Rhodotorula kratochvilovae]
MAVDAPALAPIIKRSTSPGQAAVGNSALKSPVFSEPPSPNPQSVQQGQGAVQQAPQTGYFSPQPSGILLNKGDAAAAASPLPRSTSRDRTHDAPGRASPGSGVPLHAPEARSHAGAGFLRVASPDGSGASDGGFSSDGAGGPASTVPSSVGSPPVHAKPTLSTLFTGSSAGSPAPEGGPGADSQQPPKRANSPPSPHCHFAPLPKPDADRPGTRRNSFANRVKPYIPPRSALERGDSLASPGADDDDQPHSPLGGSYHPGDSSIPSASALSQRLSSSLTFADARSSPSSGQHALGSASPSRPTSRRSSSSRRSRSPSPPGGARFRPTAAQAAAAAAAAGASRSHSPNLSRHASTDALSLHYIEGDAADARRERHAVSRTSSRAGSERGGGVGVEWQVGGGGEEGAFGGGAGSRRPSADRGHSLSRAGGAGSSAAASGFVDKDKEADLHRLVDKAQHGNADAERAVSPALAAQALRERSASRGAEGEGGRATVLKRTANEEVVEVGPGEEKVENEELEEVLEEEEEEDDDDEDGDDDEGGGDDEEDDDDDEEGERSRDQEEDTDEEEEVEPHEERKTSKGAAVEVVRWHRPERDQEREQQPSPALRVPSPSPAGSTPTHLLSPPAPPIATTPSPALAAPATPSPAASAH